MPLEQIRERMARDRAAGIERTYKSAGAPAPTQSLPVRTDCSHLGGRVPGQPCGSQLMRCNLHRTTTTRHNKCSHADRHCPTCPDNTTLAAKQLPTVRVGVISPPILNASPRSRCAVVTVVTGAGAEQIHTISRQYHERYAARLGADYVVLDEPPPCADYPISAKWRLGGLLDHYERIAFVDADALPLPGCPDLFELCREDEFGYHDDLPGTLALGNHGFLAEYHELRAAIGAPPVRDNFVMNSGVMVYSQAHREVMRPPENIILPRRHCTEQNWFTIRLHDLGAKRRPLPSSCNYQWWEQRQFAGIDPKSPPPVILHFSGIVPMKPNEHRLRLMRAWGIG